MNRRQIAAVSLTLLLGIAAVPVATADTQLSDKVPCNIVSYLYTNCMFSFGFDYNDGDSDTVHQDIETQLTFAVEERESDLSQTRNYLNRTYGVAMSEAKLTGIKELNNGSTKSEALSTSLDDVNNFYSAQQKRIIETKNREVLKINESQFTISNTDNLVLSDVYKMMDSPNTDYDGTPESFEVTETNYTLYNGTDIESYGLKVYDTSNTGDSYGDQVIPGDIENQSEGWLEVIDLDGNTTRIIPDTNPYRETYLDIDQIHDRSYSNVETVINEIYSNYDQGDINVSDAIGPLETTQLAATNYESTGSLDYAALSLEQMGLATNETASFKINYTENNESKTAWGNLFVTGDYDGSLQAGENYTLESAYFMEQLDGEVKTIDLSGKTFSIAEMVNPETGDQINKTTVQNNRYYTQNTTELEAQLEEMREDFQEYAKTSGGGFWTDAPGWLTNPFGDLGISKHLLALIAGLVLFIAGVIAS